METGERLSLIIIIRYLLTEQTRFIRDENMKLHKITAIPILTVSLFTP